jgi:NTP pyrophosphatase (non-canonical NTP hydrolase)
MDLEDYAAAAARTRNPALDDADRLFDAAAGLAEEAGEVLGAIRKHRFQGRPLDRDALVEELGDALWCLTTAAAALGASLDEVAARNVAKLARRYPDGADVARGRAADGPGSP